MSSSQVRAVAAPQGALAGFCNMFCVGAFYSLSALQFELPRILGASHSWSFAPFAAVCLGLSAGVATCSASLSGAGAAATAARGTMLWGAALVGAGYALDYESLVLILATLAAGGIGVGWTYLAVIVMVGQGFPNHPLARNAIGPLGFSSGTASCLVLRYYLGFGALDASQVARILQSGGLVSLIIGLACGPCLSTKSTQMQAVHRGQSENTLLDGTGFLSTLLFFNALPGMTAFSGLLPATVAHGLGTNDTLDPTQNLPFGMIALTLGGFLANSIAATVGPRRTFIALFMLRGVLLIAFSVSRTHHMAKLTLAAILFAHGTGFSVLPGLVKNQLADASSFAAAYGRVLISWGVAGIVGSMLNAVLFTTTEGAALVGYALGSVSLLSAALLYGSSIGTSFLP